MILQVPPVAAPQAGLRPGGERPLFAPGFGTTLAPRGLSCGLARQSLLRTCTWPSRRRRLWRRTSSNRLLQAATVFSFASRTNGGRQRPLETPKQFRGEQANLAAWSFGAPLWKTTRLHRSPLKKVGNPSAAGLRRGARSDATPGLC